MDIKTSSGLNYPKHGGPVQMFNTEDLISHLSGDLNAADRAAFRRERFGDRNAEVKAQFIEPSLQSGASTSARLREDSGTVVKR